ncbi:MAG: NADH:ubiquinone reductase (Na(+)-transporting) subunit C [Parachlamydiaceae bacterium]|nr:NADH:ubiquinone reductase (Na(+)-transporting) subunit C [Parachlamydiaceae bacterium]
MSEQAPPKESNTKTIIFMVVLSFICALVLSVLASALAEPKEIAKDLDRSKQMMIAAKVLSHQEYFLMQDSKGAYVPAKLNSSGILESGTTSDIASQAQLLEVYKKRFPALLVDDKGNQTTFEKAKIKEEEYLVEYKKTGYYKRPQKLIYAILPPTTAEQTEQPKPMGYVIPVNGYGLWDAIYGYLAIKPDGDTVIGISWYDQKETPGLGANISEADWQNFFPGKKIFQPVASGQPNFQTAPLGITVVKGKVSDVLGDSLKAQSAVDGMAGATLTGNGVTDAYREVLAAYRPFLIRVHEENAKESSNPKAEDK